LNEGVERPVDQRRHADQKAERDRNDHGEKIAEPDARDRIAELDSKALFVRPVIVERPLDVFPQFGADIERAGIADLPWVALRPISLAYSGVMLATAPVPRVAICQMPMKERNSAIDTIAARNRSELVISLSPLAGSRRAKLALRGSG